MGYFGFRAAPLGAVPARVVEARFANFAPAMVARSIPDAWSFASPSSLIEVRASSASAALRLASREAGRTANAVNEDLLAIVQLAEASGRPLFAANRAVSAFEDPVVQLWQHCTALREHRGDGHVAALTTHGIDGCEAHRLIVADDGPPAALLFESRGWSLDEWEAAADRLHRRGLLGKDGITNSGREIRATVEARTDELALFPLTVALGEEGTARLIANLTPLATKVIEAEVLPFPNPIGLPKFQRN